MPFRLKQNLILIVSYPKGLCEIVMHSQFLTKMLLKYDVNKIFIGSMNENNQKKRLLCQLDSAMLQTQL